MSSADFDAMIAAARAERLDAVLAHHLRDVEASRNWPVAALTTLFERSRQHLVLESMRRRELVRLLDAFAEARVEVLLLKGAGLAYTVYPAPHLRPRDDTDLLIRRGDLDRTERVLAACGYARAMEPDAELASTQRHYRAVDPAGLPHVVDLHWRIAIPRLFVDALTFDEVWPRAMAVPPLGTTARTLGFTDALLLACVHRVAHHQDAPALLWLWDIHLLVERLASDQHAAFAARAGRSQMCGVCLRGLSLARDRFGTDCRDIAAALEAARAGVDETSARFVGGGLRPIEVLRADLQALHGWGERLQLLREHLFPPAAYMRATCGPRVVLPFAYLRRIVHGAPEWLRRR